ncbi:MAG: FHA domain-containing protein [Polyangiaceae bacterium]|nr:FHA domain-containing protein [Polyangiaceae bacterium]
MRYAPPAQAPSYAPPVDAGVRQSPIPPSAARSGVDPEQVPPDAPRALAGFLVSFEGDALGQFWPFHQGRNEVGRLGANPSLDLALDHPTTSSRHAVLLASVRPTRAKIEDVGSTNGTYVNGERITPGVKQELHDGDYVRFGGFTTTIKLL